MSEGDVPFKCEADLIAERLAALLKDLLPAAALAVRDSEIARLKEEVARLHVVMEQRRLTMDAYRELVVDRELRIVDLEGQLKQLKGK